MSSDNTSNNKENTNPMTKEDAARIQAAKAKKSDTGETAAGSFAARAQSAADKNEKDTKPAAADPAGGGTSPSSGDRQEAALV
ncbi:hypothetical protein PG991_007747 [Apiospora marii]|uniref:SMP domain-containing protein n=1 Tax=Apiospora marii TaxID=335849 RepID=A0ABR1RUH9_9PEZI